jgi:hypothetical protein
VKVNEKLKEENAKIQIQLGQFSPKGNKNPSIFSPLRGQKLPPLENQSNALTAANVMKLPHAGDPNMEKNKMKA